MAAEFTVAIILLYEKLKFGKEKLPDAYPQGALTDEQRNQWWKNYWS